MSDQAQTASHIYNEAGTYYPQATCGGYTATFEPGVTVTGLPAPTGVTATATGETTIDVAWAAVDGADSYTVTYWPTADPTATQSVDSTTLNATLTGLAAATEYTITVRANDAAGAGGEESDPVTATTEGTPDQLPTPTGITATDVTDTSATVSWDAVTGADGYTYSLTPADGDNPTGTVTDPTIALTGLIAGTDYSIDVVATDSTGAAADSEPGTGTFSTTGTGPLPTPQNVTASAITATSATITWDAVTGADQYSVTYTPDGTTPVTVTDPTIDLTGLTDGIEYTVSVVAQDTTGGAQDSPAGTATFTASDTPPLPAPTGLDTGTPTDTGTTVTWNAVTGADGYRVTYWPTATPADTEFVEVAATTTDLSGLNTGTEYTVEVVATDSTGTSGDSAPATGTFTTTGTPQLAAPTNVAASDITATSATIAWDAVTGADGYTVILDPPDGTVTVDPAVPNASATGLTASTPYTVSVVATDSTGAATDSDPGTGNFTTIA